LLRKLCDGAAVGEAKRTSVGGGDDRFAPEAHRGVCGSVLHARPRSSLTWLGLASMVLGCELPGAPGDTEYGPSSPSRMAASLTDPCSVAQPAPDSLAQLGALPQEPPGFCLDPYGTVRVYQPADGVSFARVCERVLGPGCQAEPREGLERVSTLRYLVRAAPGAEVDAVVAQFRSSEGAYAHFTQLVIGDADPASLAVSVLELPGVGVLRTGGVVGYRGRHVFWLRYAEEQQPPEARLRAARQHLPELAQLISASLPAEEGLPIPVQKLPLAQRLPLGVRLVLDDALGVSGLGVSAQGYYAEGEKRWRVITIVRPDSESAKDVVSSLLRHPAAKKIKNAPLDAVQFIERRLPSEPHVGWVVGQRAEVVYGIGDEASVLPEFMPAQREAAVKLSLLEKLVKLTRIHIR
jgi:uncharacterized protein DUF6599